MNEKDALTTEEGVLIKATTNTNTGHLTLRKELDECELIMSTVGDKVKLTISMTIKDAKIANHSLDTGHFPTNQIFIKGTEDKTIILPLDKFILFEGTGSSGDFQQLKFTFGAMSDDDSGGKVGGPGL